MKKVFIRCLFILITALALSAASAKAATSAKSDIQPLTATEAKALVAKKPAKPRIIAVWSIDCPYCQRNLQQLAAEARKRQSFELVLISVDPIEEAATLTKLQDKLGARGFESYASAESTPERFRYALDPSWGGEMPRTFFIGTDGARYATSGLMNSELLAKWLSGGK